MFCWKAKEASRRMGKREHSNIRGNRNNYTMEKIAKRTRPVEFFYWNRETLAGMQTAQQGIIRDR